jgi:hypothetical protein
MRDVAESTLAIIFGLAIGAVVFFATIGQMAIAIQNWV